MSSEQGPTPPEREAMQRLSDLAAAREHTHKLRYGADPRWERVRAQLERARVRVEDAAIASKNTEDHRLEAVLLVARDGRAFSFEFDFLRDEQGRDLSYEDARVAGWEELDERQLEIHGRSIEIGREILAEPPST